MATVRRQRRRRNAERGALQILEEAFHLLRTTRIENLLLFYGGTIPFAAVAMIFVADMSRSSFAVRDAAAAALGMTAVYFLMKWCHAAFAARLWESLSPGGVPRRSGWKRFRYVAALWCLQAFHAPVLFVASFFLLPLGWAIAAWENITVLAFVRDYGDRPLRGLLGHGIRLSHRAWGQNHGILIVLGFVALFLWVNLLGTCLLVPGFLKSFLGIDTLFTINPGAAIGNSTFLFGTFLLVNLFISPMLKAVAVLRCFYAESRETGADLLSRLASCEQIREREERRNRLRGRGIAAVIVAVIVAGCLLVLPVSVEGESSSRAASAEAGVRSTDPEALRDSIGRTMEQKKYQWRLSRQDLREQRADREKTWFGRQMDQLADSIEATLERWRERIENLFRRMFQSDREPRSRPANQGASFAWSENMGSLKVVFLVIAGALLLFWLARVIYRETKNARPRDAADADSSAPVDLESEDIVASQLPEEEWMRLAREQIARGETRLAVRALFLSSLAHLGDKGLLKIARFKSNRDYRGELEMRARHLGPLRDAFDENTGLFERAWYGLHQLGEDAVDRFMKNCEQIAAEAPAMPKREGEAGWQGS